MKIVVSFHVGWVSQGNVLVKRQLLGVLERSVVPSSGKTKLQNVACIYDVEWNDKVDL